MIDTQCPWCKEKDAEIARLQGELTIADAEVARMRKYQDQMFTKMKGLEALLHEMDTYLEKKATEHDDTNLL